MDLHLMRLWDIYNPLLTDTQREITNLYFNFDLSLAEIAEEKGCSRQSVSDCLNKCRKLLEEYEEKLGFCRILTEHALNLSFLMADVGKWAEGLPSPQKEEALKLLDRDYSKEVQRALEENRDTLA